MGFDETCQSGLAGYGVALVNGQNVLSGPALKRDNLQPGMGAIQMGGETWEKRLGEICRKFVYEQVGEDDLYERFRREGAVSAELCVHETRACLLGPESPLNMKKSTKPAKEKKKPKQGKRDAVGDGGKDANMDVSGFVAKLAKKHGVGAPEYSRKRSFAEW